MGRSDSKRGRRVAMAGAGLATAAAPFILGQQVAAAAQTSASDIETIRFIKEDDHFITECTASLSTVHNTDDPNQPSLSFTTGLTDGPGCLDVGIQVTASYKDQDGITRTADFAATSTSSGTVRGAYTNTTVTAQYFWFSCDSTQSSRCSVTLTASPK
jgi:hypothetical protein